METMTKNRDETMLINRPTPLIIGEGLRHDCNPSVASLRLYSHPRNRLFTSRWNPPFTSPEYATYQQLANMHMSLEKIAQTLEHITSAMQKIVEGP